MSRNSVSAVIPTKNVADIITPTLESLRFCDEVIIVDMFSTDETRSVCEKFSNVRFFQREDYIYGNFNYGVEQATSEWIIRIDSDEVISPELRDSIIEVLQSENSRHNSYEAFCHLYFFGKHRLRHGFGNQWRTMLFRKETARYEVRSEHEGLVLQGSVGRLKGHYDHFTNPTITAWIEKTNYYTSRDVERLAEPQPLSKVKVIYQTVRMFQRFYLRPYWLCRDGYMGFVVAGIVAFSLFVQHSKTWEKYEQQKTRT
ncbi:MAG: glycosyltransferase family 2 protein [Pyrinomonadaceae bacterium MAG19_C2-C3]|nr:glycosyltransferase family 2 protein [Pyrinomonadaceae bacterium MAG19_C2-C3]